MSSGMPESTSPPEMRTADAHGHFSSIAGTPISCLMRLLSRPPLTAPAVTADKLHVARNRRRETFRCLVLTVAGQPFGALPHRGQRSRSNIRAASLLLIDAAFEPARGWPKGSTAAGYPTRRLESWGRSDATCSTLARCRRSGATREAPLDAEAAELRPHYGRIVLLDP